MTDTWDTLFAEWHAVQGLSGEEPFRRLTAARRRVAYNTPEDWLWLEKALADAERKFFVALVFEKQPLPKRLLTPFLEAAIHTGDPSTNRAFISPCVRSYGAARVLTYLLNVLKTGTDEAKAGAVSAAYWVRENPRHEDIAALHQAFDNARLETFVSCTYLQLQRNLIASLKLDATRYPENLRHLIPHAISIARHHADDYIRHRVEIQLGTGPQHFRPIPHD